MKKFLLLLGAVISVGVGMPIHASEENACDASAELLAANRTRPAEGATEKQRKQRLKVVAVDVKGGRVTAQPLNGHDVLTFQLTARATKSLRAGQVVDIDYLAANGFGKRFCPCGKKNDGSCWCTGNRPCCGPLAGCPIGSCDKKQPIPNVDDKPTLEGNPGSGARL